MPAWAYRRARGEGARPDPIVFRRGKVLRSSKQDREHLLCSSCEQRFGRVEDRVSRVVYQVDGTAPFLSQVGQVVAVGESRMRAALPGTLALDDLIYFGASVIWRASVSTVVHNCDLGELYSEQFRSFLLGQSEFPADATLLVVFYDLPIDDMGPGALQSLCTTPTTEQNEDGVDHEFLVFGLRIRVVVGRAVPGWLKQLCVLRSAEKFIALAPQEELISWLGEAMTAAEPIGSLARERQKPSLSNKCYGDALPRAGGKR